MTLVADASAIVRLLLKAPGHEIVAERLAMHGAIAPDFVLVEIDSALWKATRAGDISATRAEQLLEEAPWLFAELPSIAPLVQPAHRFAQRLNHPIYDCIYLALALRDELPILTADKRLAVIAEGMGISAERV